MHCSKIGVADRKLTDVFRMVGQVLGLYLRRSADGEVGMSMPAAERRQRVPERQTKRPGGQPSLFGFCATSQQNTQAA